jgi:hypothetical protein
MRQFYIPCFPLVKKKLLIKQEIREGMEIGMPFVINRGTEEFEQWRKTT